MQMIITHDTVSDLITSVYGTGTVSGTTTTTWDFTGAGGTTQDITFTAPDTTDNQGWSLVAVNAKGLVVKPIMELGTGWQAEAKFTCDKFQGVYDSDTTD